MGANTRFGTAIFGALLMFFLGSNLTMIGEYTGLVPQRILRWFGASLHFGGGGGAGGSGSRERKVKVDPAAELLQRVLADDKRELCRTRYPQGLLMTPAQVDFVGTQRYFVVLTLRNNEEMLHHTLYELLHVISKLGPSNVFVSVFENNSKDKTPQFLAFFTDMLKLAGVHHHLVSSLTWAKEVEAAQKQAAAAAGGKGGRRLLEEGEEEGDSLWWNSTRTARQEEYEDEPTKQRLRGSSDLSEEELALLMEALQVAEAAGKETEETSSQAAPAIAGARGRMLAEKNKKGSSNNNPPPSPSDAGDILSFEEKWKGNRIEFLARVRNWAIRPLFGQRRKYQRVILMNDAYVCAEDILRLVLHNEADVACGLDFDTTSHYGIGFYDTWVDRDIHGEPFKKHPPFVQRGPDAELLKKGRTFPVFCCWNGVLVASAQPFYEGLRFRRGVPGECAASECSLFCKDFWAHGKTRFAIDPHVRVAYDLPTYNGLHTVNWLEEGPWVPPGPPRYKDGVALPYESDGNAKRGTNRSQVEWPDSTPYPPHPPNRVFCCGLEGNGRDADQPCIRETLKLPPKGAAAAGKAGGGGNG